MPRLVFRPHRPGDVPGIAQVFFDSVNHGTRAHYGPEQRMAWAGPAPDADRWRHRLDEMTVFVADRDGTILGFMSLDRNGLLHHAFVAPSEGRQGIGGRLYALIEQAAARQGNPRLHAEISLAARGFFLRRGWSVMQEQQIERAGVRLTNFRMEKPRPEAGWPTASAASPGS